MTPTRRDVRLGDRSYPVYVGRELLERADTLLPLPPRAQVVAVVTDAAVAALHRERLLGALGRLPVRVEELVLEPGERSKDVQTLAGIWRWLAARGVHRGDLVLALGGGVVGDVAGFAAATYHRGVAFVQCPTTLLAQVDAAIGGKTAVDLPEGKNLVGAFHQPRAVLADVDALLTLPPHAFATGMAEVVKHALIGPETLLRRLRDARERISARDPEELCTLVSEAAAVKIDVVERDERESDVRAHLNYGHTLGHALEAANGYERFTHGEAVAIGMMFVARLAVALGHADRVQEHRELLEAYGLPTTGAGAAWPEVRAAMARDKKYDAGHRFVVLEDLGRPTIAHDVDESLLERLYEEVR